MSGQLDWLLNKGFDGPTEGRHERGEVKAEQQRQLGDLEWPL